MPTLRAGYFFFVFLDLRLSFVVHRLREFISRRFVPHISNVSFDFKLILCTVLIIFNMLRRD